MRAEWTLAAALVLATVLAGPWAAALADGQGPGSDLSVLVLLPGQPGLPAATSIATGIRAPLVGELSFRVSIETEHVDIARFASPAEEERRLRAVYGSKYARQRFDLIIAAAAEPLQFALRARDDLWPGTPVIACVIDERAVRDLVPPARFTVVTVRYDVESTLRVALGLLPDTRQVALVGGAGPQERPFHDLARQAVRSVGPQLTLIDLTKLPVADLLTRVAALPERTIILISSYQVDGAGRRFYGLDVLGPLAARASRPAFSVFGNALGGGIVGGMLTDFEAAGREAGRLGVGVLRGEPLPSGVQRSAVPNALRFDGRQLARWRIGEERLPPGSEILHRPLTLWQEYQWHIVGAVVLFAAQAGLIAALLVQLRLRREAQARLAERLRFAAVVSEVGAALTTAPAARVDDQIRECLRRVVTSLEVDRGALWQPRAGDNTILVVTHSWTAGGGKPPPAELDLRHFPYFAARTEAAEDSFSFARLEDLPAEARAERAAFEREGIRAFAAIRVRAGERALGYLTFVSRHAERVWSVDVMQQLQMLAEHFANALIQGQSAAAVETSAAFTEAVLAALPGDVAVLDSAGTIVQTNEAWATVAKTAPPAVQLALAVGGNYLDACRSAFGMPADVAFKLQHSLVDVLHGGLEELTLEYRASRDGVDRWQEVRVRRLARHGGGAAVMHFDVTARRQAEAASQRHLGQLAHLDRVAGMGQLAASIAHELNQPLTAIMANAQAARRLMQAPEPDYAEVAACLADIIGDDSRAAEVIRRMRRLLKKSDFASLPISLNDLVTMTIGLVANDALLHATAIEFKPAPALPVVYGDLVQVQQVILNLLANAISAAATGSCPVRQVSVWTQVVSPPYVELGVQDSGDGIREEDLHRLFEPFFTRKADGLGMGLAISRTIVEAHGGELTGENAPAGGAIFRVHLRTDQPTT